MKAFVDVIKTVRKVRHRLELECHFENLMTDIGPFIKDSKKIYFQAIGRERGNDRPDAQPGSGNVLLEHGHAGVDVGGEHHTSGT